MSNLSGYPTRSFKESQKFLVEDPSTGTASLVLGSDLVSYITPQLDSVIAESTRLAAENTDYEVGKVIQTTGATSPGDNFAAVYLVVEGGTGDFPMINGNDLLVIRGDEFLREQLISEEAGEGASLVSMEGGPTVEAAVTQNSTEIAERVIRKSTVAEIESLTGAEEYQVSLSGLKAGIFEFDSSDLSSKVTADTHQGVYIAPSSDATGASGAWVRQIPDGVIRGEFYGQGSAKTSAENAAITEEMCRYARANDNIHTIRLAAGSWDSDRFEIDVDRRGFHVTGAGQDATIITSKSTTESMVVIRIDPRNRALDSQHDYVTVDGFTVDGDISGRGASAAQRCIVVPNYAKIGIKSVGHIKSNLDINGLVCTYYGHVGGRTNGGTSTENSLRFQNNGIKTASSAYANGTGGGTSNAVVMDDKATTLASPITAGDSVITLDSGHEIETYQRIEIGDSAVDVLYVIDVTGDDITLDSPTSTSRSAGEAVKLPMIGNHYVGTIELGDFITNNSISCSVSNTYSEDCAFNLSGYLRNFAIHHINCSEESPSIFINDLDRRSSVAIRDNETAFSIDIDCSGRQGVVDDRIDVRFLPDLYIENNRRGQNKIRVNGTYVFSYLKVQKDFSASLGGSIGTMFEFDGLFAAVPATTTQSVLKFYLEATATNLDGFTFDTFTSTRRPSGVSDRQVGVFSRQGIASTDGTLTTVSTNDIVTDYVYSVDNGNAVDVNFAVSTTECSIDVSGESGSLDTWTFTRGKIYSMKA